RNIAGRLAASGGMANVDGVAQTEMLDDRGHVSGIMIHVVAIADLRRPAVAAPVMSNCAVAPFDKVQQLRVPVVGAQWPAVVEDDRLPRAPVLVENIDAIFGSDRAHSDLSIWSEWRFG